MRKFWFGWGLFPTQKYGFLHNLRMGVLLQTPRFGPIMAWAHGAAKHGALFSSPSAVILSSIGLSSPSAVILSSIGLHHRLRSFCPVSGCHRSLRRVVCGHSVPYRPNPLRNHYSPPCRVSFAGCRCTAASPVCIQQLFFFQPARVGGHGGGWCERGRLQAQVPNHLRRWRRGISLCGAAPRLPTPPPPPCPGYGRRCCLGSGRCAAHPSPSWSLFQDRWSVPATPMAGALQDRESRLMRECATATKMSAGPVHRNVDYEIRGSTTAAAAAAAAGSSISRRWLCVGTTMPPGPPPSPPPLPSLILLSRTSAANSI